MWVGLVKVSELTFVNFVVYILRPRGFGQLVRARNIKTVGDLSALTPAEIKALPIRSPKLSNVKKALKSYHEQQVLTQCSVISVIAFNA